MMMMSLGEDERDDQPVKSQCLREDEDQDHAHEDAFLLGVGPHARVADHADGQPRGQ
jgi:hypothetical protein